MHGLLHFRECYNFNVDFTTVGYRMAFGRYFGKDLREVRRKKSIGGNVPCKNGVLVWEWELDDGVWQPFSPQISTFIESSMPQNRFIQPGSTDSDSVLDIYNMRQIFRDSGIQRAIRRAVYPATSAIGRGITWQWESVDGNWHNFDIDVSIYIDDCWIRGISDVPLRPMFDIMERIDLKRMDIRKDYPNMGLHGECIRIRQAFLPVAYPTFSEITK